MNSKNMKAAGILYLVATLINKGMAFVAVPILTRLLSTSDYGIVSTYNSWVDILTIVLSMSLFMSVRTAYVDFPGETDAYLSSITTFITLVSGVFVLIAVLGNQLLHMNMLILFCVIQGFSNALLTNYTQDLMMQYRFLSRTALMILPNLLSTGLSVAVVVLFVKTSRYLGVIIPTVLVYAAFGIIVSLLIYLKVKPHINMTYVKYGLAMSLPLVFHGIALSILAQADRTMITLLANASQTGIYSLVYNFSMSATVVTTALEGIWIPWFMLRLKQKDYSSINNMTKDYVNLMTYAIISLTFIGPELLKLLAARSYWAGITIIPPIVLSNYIIFLYTLFVYVEQFHKKTIIVAVNTVIAAVINISLNWVLIPKFGYVSAAYTTLLSYIVACLLHMRYAKRLEESLYRLKSFISPLLQVLIATLLYYVTLDYWWIRWPLLFVYLLAMVFYNRKRLGEFVPQLSVRFAFFR